MDHEKRLELAKRKTKGLMLTRREADGILIGDDIRITVAEIEGSQVKILVDAPKDVSVDRLELVLEGDKTE